MKKIMIRIVVIVIALFASISVSYAKEYGNYYNQSNIIKSYGNVYYKLNNAETYLYRLEEGRSKLVVRDYIEKMIPYKNHILLQSGGDEYSEEGLYLYNVSNADYRLLKEGWIKSFSIHNDMLYYYDRDEKSIMKFNIFNNELKEEVVLKDVDAHNMIATDEGLYFTDYYECALFKLDFNTLQKTKILENKKFIRTGYFNMDDEFIYFIEDDGLFKYDLVTKKVTLIDKYITTGEILIAKNNIYVIKNNRMLYGYKNNGERSDKIAYNKNTVIGVMDEELYSIENKNEKIAQIFDYESGEEETIYTNIQDIKYIKEPYIVHVKGDELYVYDTINHRNRLVDEIRRFIGVIENNMYYIDDDNNRLYTSKLDKDEKQMIMQGEFREGKIYDNKIIVDKDSQYVSSNLVYIDIKTNKEIDLEIKDCDEFIIKDDYVYYIKDKTLYKKGLKGGKSTLCNINSDYAKLHSSDKYVFIKNGYKIYVLNEETSKLEAKLYDIKKVLEAKGEFLYLFGYTEGQRGMLKYNMENGEILLVGEGADVELIYDDNKKCIYYSDELINEYNYLTKTTKRLLTNVKKGAVYNNNKIYYTKKGNEANLTKGVYEE